MYRGAGTAVAALTAVSCARIGPPPGGEVDKVPPLLVSTRPESLAVFPDFKGEVEFRFNEVISEGSQPNQGLGTGDLERLVLLSPSGTVPSVRWKRDRITVHPREGWKPNRVYRVELLPGVTDLWRNRTDSGAVITFSTGAPLPTARLSGQVVDWVGQKVGKGALVEALLLPDSLGYRTVADSTGRYLLAPVPRGSYLVFASVDQNKNLRRDAREAFDSARSAPDSSMIPVLWMIPYDTLGPRMQTVTLGDSLTANVAFTQPLDPYQTIDTSEVELRLLPDSTRIPVRSLLPKPIDDSLQRVARARTDSLRADSLRADSLARAADSSRTQKRDSVRPGKQLPPALKPPPMADRRPSGEPDTAAVRKLLARRPVPTDQLTLRVAVPFTPGGKYVLGVRGVRNVNGAPADSHAGFAVPVPQLPKPSGVDSLRRKAPPDSMGPDSTRADSTARPEAPR